jgi:hypothetical protein
MAARVSATRVGPAARATGLAAAAFAAAILAAACSPTTGGPGLTYPPSSAQPTTADTPAIDLAVAELVTALGDQGLTMQDPQRPYRPAEGPALAGTPRVVYQVVLPDDPTHGYLVIYDLPDASRAWSAPAAAGPTRRPTSGPARVASRPRSGPATSSASWARR